MLASGSHDKTIKIWDQNGNHIETIAGKDGHAKAVFSVAFSPLLRTRK